MQPDLFTADHAERPHGTRRQTRHGEVIQTLIRLAEFWAANQHTASSIPRENFDRWVRSLEVAAAGLGAAPAALVRTLDDDVEAREMELLCAAAIERGARKILPQPPVENSPQPLAATPCRRGLVTPLLRLRFGEVVGVAIEAGLFRESLVVNARGELGRDCRCSFARVLKRWNERQIGDSFRLRSVGVAHARRYVFETISKPGSC